MLGGVDSRGFAGVFLGSPLAESLAEVAANLEGSDFCS